MNKKKILQDYAGGLTIYEIADKHGSSKSTIDRLLRAEGIDTTRRLKIDKVKLVDLYVDQDLSAVKVGEILGCCHQTVIRNLKELGVEMKSVNHYRGEKAGCWKGCGELSGGHWGGIVSHADSRKIEVCITIEDAWELFLRQNRLCALTGFPIKFGSYHTNEETTASLDRIDSKGDYTFYNIQWVHKIINRMKWDVDQDEFIRLCVAVTKKHAPLESLYDYQYWEMMGAI